MSRLLVLQLFFFLLCWQEYCAQDCSKECNTTSDSCFICFNRLVCETIKPRQNQYNLQRAFFPPDKENPVYVTVHYIFPNGGQKTWFWSESTYFALFHPLPIYQLTSLFFGDFNFRKEELTLHLKADCQQAEDPFMMLLTQRVCEVM